MAFFATALLRTTGLYHPLRNARRDWRFRRANAPRIRQWRRAGRPAPAPDLVKYRELRGCARRAGARVLVETGTFYGDAIFFLRRDFSEIHSIEIAPGLHGVSLVQFSQLPHIHLHLGGSAEVLPRLLPGLAGPTVFWLDGHFCAGPSQRGAVDPPIGTELDHLLRRAPGRDLILIDDARHFTGKDGYPTMDELRELVRRYRPEVDFRVDLDIIRIGPV